MVGSESSFFSHLLPKKMCQQLRAEDSDVHVLMLEKYLNLTMTIKLQTKPKDSRTNLRSSWELIQDDGLDKFCH